MGKPQKQKKPERLELTGLERLGLRVSAMINSPVAQIQRWVTIHRPDTDGEREWEEVLGVLSETDELEITLNDDDTVTLKWESQADDDRPIEVFDVEVMEEPAPF